MGNEDTRPRRVEIDMFKINDIAQRGIRRAAVFMGLGVNAADSETLTEHRLVKDTNLRILPETVSAEVTQAWKSEFRRWVVSCGFRELVDRLCVYVDEIHRVCHFANRTLTEDIAQEFERLGLDKKLAKLESQLGIASLHIRQISTFYPIRNCFAHRTGRVGEADLKNGTKLELKYLKLSFVSVKEDKSITVLPDLMVPATPPAFLEGGDSFAVQFKEETVAFGLNEVIHLTPRQLTDILFSRTCLLRI